MAQVRYSYDYYESYRKLVEQFNPKYGLEIGVEEGDSAEAFLSVGSSSKLVGIDPQDLAVERLKKFGDRFIYVRGFTPEAFSVVKKRTFDWIYIDGDHAYDAVLSDATLAWPMLKKDGVMVFDDYKSSTDVSSAIDAFVLRIGKALNTVPRHPHGAVWIQK